MRRDRRQLFRDGRLVALSGKAFELLNVFLDSGGRVLTREQLYKRLWGDGIVEEANLSQAVYLLRRAVEPDGDGRAIIETIPRVGYRFAPYVNEGDLSTSRRRLRVLYGGTLLCGVVFATCALWLMSSHYAAISVAAWDADELGEYHLGLRTPEHLAYSLSYFMEAERAAPADAVAFAGAASAYALLAEFQEDASARQRALITLANESSAAALRRDAHCSLGLAVQGFIAYRFEGRAAAATRDLDRSLTIDPRDAEAHLWRGILLMSEGDGRDAESEFRLAHQLSPVSEVYSRWLARAYAFERKPDQAIAEALETLRIEPADAPAMLTVADAQEQRGNLEAALATLRTLVQKDPYEERFVAPDEARLDLRLGNFDSSLLVRHFRKLAESGRVDPFETALLFLTAGDKLDATRMLRRTSHSSLIIQRYDPRLLALL